MAGWYKTAIANGNAAIYFPGPVKAWPDGTYDADLILDYSLAATISFTVGSSGSGGAGGAGGTTVGGVTVLAFIPTNRQSVAAWLKRPDMYPLPIKQQVFGPGIAKIAFCFVYKGAQAGVTTYELVVNDTNGLKITVGGPHKVQNGESGYRDIVAAPQHLAYPNGAYTAVLLIDGAQAAQTTFTVG